MFPSVHVCYTQEKPKRIETCVGSMFCAVSSVRDGYQIKYNTAKLRCQILNRNVHVHLVTWKPVSYEIIFIHMCLCSVIDVKYGVLSAFYFFLYLNAYGSIEAW